MINISKEEKNKKDSILKRVFKGVTNSFLTITTVITSFQALAIFQPITLFYSLFLLVINILLFSFIKDFLDDKIKKTGFILFKASLIIFIFNILALIDKFLSKYSSSGKSLKPMVLLLGIGATISIVAVFTNEKTKELLQNIYDKSLLEKLGLSKESDVIKQGDAVICVNAETKKPVSIPFDDRFLHMLVLGPTGCGKTSQVLIPLINQDMQNEGYGITVIEPKGDLAEKIYAMAKHYNKEAIYFNPTLPDCPYFNPLYGPEDEVVENMATTFKMLNPDSPQFFQDMNETLIRKSLQVLKRLKGNSATLVDLSTLIYNSQGQGKIMVNQFARLKTDTVEMAKENGETAAWFLSDYYNERSKTYEHCSGLRSQVSKITSNMHLRRVLNPPNGENDVNFEKVIEEGKILAISTAQGDLRDLGRFLGYFIILNFQSAVFKRPGNENTRRPHFLYIDEFQVYSNPGFADMLTQGRSYRVASHLATQNRALMAMGGGRDGKNFVELVSTNARNVIIFPGGNSSDAKYYSDEFGEVTETEYRTSISKAKFNPLYGIKKVNYPNESISESEVTKARFSASDIIFKKFGEVTYRIVKNKTVQIPGAGMVSWIPKELNKKLDGMVEEYNEMQKAKLEALTAVKNDDEDETKPPVDAVESLNNPYQKDNKGNEDFEMKFQENKIGLEKPTINTEKREEIVIDLNDESLDDLI